MHGEEPAFDASSDGERVRARSFAEVRQPGVFVRRSVYADRQMEFVDSCAPPISCAPNWVAPGGGGLKTSQSPRRDGRAGSWTAGRSKCRRAVQARPSALRSLRWSTGTFGEGDRLADPRRRLSRCALQYLGRRTRRLRHAAAGREGHLRGGVGSGTLPRGRPPAASPRLAAAPSRLSFR